MMDRLFELEVASPEAQIDREADGAIGREVGRKKISAMEATTAKEILKAYNEIAKPSRPLVGLYWIKKIVLRLREHPEVSIDEHRQIIMRNFSNPWWPGQPTPSVIYGNPGIFESAMLNTGKKVPRTQAEKKSERLRKLLS